MFPWTFQGTEYNGCANPDKGSISNGVWCPTELSIYGTYVEIDGEKLIGLCNENCPIAICDDPIICPKPGRNVLMSKEMEQKYPNKK